MIKYAVGFLCFMLTVVSPVRAEQDLPQVKEIGTVAPNVVMIKIAAQRVENGKQIPYEENAGDVVDKGQHRFVRRNGKLIGALAGAEGTVLFTADQLVGEPLDVQWAMKPENYRIVSSDDERFAEGLAPKAVYRKTRPSGYTRTAEATGIAHEHFLYLTASKELQAGKHYTVEFQNTRFSTTAADFVYDPSALTSDAVHVSQIGFEPKDPKVAFLSCWMGDGGGLAYKDGLAFSLIDHKSGEPVFEGKTRLAKSADQTEAAGTKNYQQTNVYEMDFSEFAAPGTYRVSVHGVGCSLPFPIAEDVWTKAFFISVRGLFHQRSGIALGPPYTDFVRPRGFHPDDGIKVYHSSFSAGEANQGDGNIFEKLSAAKTDEIIPDAWGGYMDAADWDRRPLHIQVSRMLLDLYEMSPETFDALALKLPESDNQLPDLLDEACWLIDFHLRTQTPEGGIRPGIESSEHPRRGEGSWQESLTIMAYAPGPSMSYRYAGVATHASLVLQKLDPERAKNYCDSAMKAFDWAEAHADDSEATAEERMLAAAELFRMTGEEKWQQIFLAKSRFSKPEATYSGNKIRGPNFDVQDEAGWVYLQTNQSKMDQAVKDNVKRALLDSADGNIASMATTAFKWIPSKFRFGLYGTTCNPDAVTLVRAHHLTGEPKYLQATVLACQYAAGANPQTLCYTTGVGLNPIKRPIHEDSYVSSQMPPPGLTVFGAIDPALRTQRGHTKAEDNIENSLYPAAQNWPITESYFDLGMHPPMTEYTVNNTITPTAYVWGYLAAR